jgi:hypothetical protein
VGLLDGNLDPQSLATLQLAGGLLSPGSFGQGIQRGLAGYQGALTSAKELQVKDALLQAQQQEQQLRALQIRLQNMKLDQAAAYLSGGGAFQAGTAAMGNQPGGALGPTTSAATAAIANQSRMVQNVTPDQAAAFLQLGLWTKDNYDLWKATKEGVQVNPGTYRLDMYSGQPTFYGDPKTGVTVGPGGVVQQMPNAAATLGALAGATKAGELQGSNANTPASFDLTERAGLPPGTPISALLNKTAPSAALTNFVARDAGGAPATLNGSPVAFKTSADLAGEKLQAEKNVQLQMDPLIELRKDIPLKAHAANQAAMSQLADITNNEGEIVARNNRLSPYLTQLPRLGGFAQDARVDFANKLKNSGLLPQGQLDALSDKVAGGDPDAAKIVANQLSAAAIQTMLDTLNKEGKPNRVMYQALKEQQEGLSAGKNVLGGVMALQKQLYDQHQQQLGTMTDLMSASDYNPVKFQSQFQTSKAKQIEQVAPAATPQATMRWNPKTGKIEPVQ